ncbi:MAG: BMP family ABC transporter substrate-binding protein, partial [Candidatus Promineifilaceae bacterium]|nr:BMP family ABC transporter substrate-binding protein [Candidatus Promineifilaceae bacterium]
MSRLSKIFWLISLILVFLVILSACQSDDSTQTESENEKIAALFMGPTTDESWNQFGLDGVKKAEEDCGIEYAFTENVKQTEFDETMRNYAQEGYSTILGHSGTFTDSAKKIASEFPNTNFIVVNAIEGNGSNMGGIYGDYWQMGY